MFKFKKTVDVDKKSKRLIEKTNQALGIIGTNSARSICPVLSGRARASISWKTGGGAGSGILSTPVPVGSVVVGSNVDYFPWIEFGGAKRAAKPTLTPSARVAGNSLKQAVIAAKRAG